MAVEMNHADYMRRALRLAAKGTTSPNPMVGAVVVKDGEIVGEGYHPRAGEPHAEVFALRNAGEKAKGATLYVTLEPCCHFGRTPPCTQAVIQAGIVEVYIGMTDPDEKVSCRGINELKKAGINVHYPLLEDDAKRLNETYIKHRTTGLPFVILKSAMSLDGKIATHTGDSKWITNERSRAYAHRIRSSVDAIIVGGNTARLDNPRLNARVGKRERYPRRVIVSRAGRIPSDLAMFSLPGETIVAVSSSADATSVVKLSEAGARIVTLEDDRGQTSLRSLMKQLGELGCLSVLVEGGGEVAAAALEERLVDKIVYFYAPKIIGGRDAASSVSGKGVAEVAASIQIIDKRIKRFGDDFVVEGYTRYS